MSPNCDMLHHCRSFTGLLNERAGIFCTPIISANSLDAYSLQRFA